MGTFDDLEVTMPTIATHLWFDREASEAARFYTGLFPDSRITSESRLDGTPSGAVDLLSFEIAGAAFQAISAGPQFKFTPAVSFLVGCDDKAEVDRYWRALSEGGSELMELGSYPFSGHYAWIVDRYGLSWQLMLADRHGYDRKITPTLMFTGDNAGRAEEAASAYAALFRGTVGTPSRYGPGAEPNSPEMLSHLDFRLFDGTFSVMDSAFSHGFGFNEAISFIVLCDSQEEIDRYWAGLSAVPEAEQCGWLKDRYGLSWQIVPTALGRLMGSSDEESRTRVTKAFLAMKKFDIAELEEAARAKA